MTSVEPATLEPTDQASSTAHPLDVAARHMYEAEIALHAARQSQVDAWVAAAYEHLHRAIAEHTAATRFAGPVNYLQPGEEENPDEGFEGNGPASIDDDFVANGL
jgi:hypothetical protein